MRINVVLLIITLIVIFILGIVLGLNLNQLKKGGEINLPSPISGSCEYNGKTYKSGEGFPAEDGCNTCGCNSGKVICTLIACP